VTAALDMRMEPAQPAPTQATQNRAKVLVVDDDERNLLALAEVLSDVAEVIQASSGEEALRCLLRDKFAVIVLDVLMPGMDGYDTAELVRAREQSRDTPIIFLTAINKEDAHLLKGYSHGAVDYVFKPFDPTIVRSKVGVFVSLHEKTMEIERNGAAQQRLLEEKLLAQQQHVAALEALRRSEEQQELILASLPIAVYVEDQAGVKRRFVSGDVKQLTGYDARAFEADSGLWWSRLDPDDAGTASSETGRGREYRWRDAAGTVRIFLDQSVALSSSDYAVAGTVRDITEQRALQDQLLQAQKIDAVGKLTGGVAHDFNNLLASVMSGLSLIERRASLDPSALEILEMTRHAAEQGKQLVSRLLAFSRRQNLSPHRVDLTPLSKSLDAMLAPLLGGLVSLQWKLEPDLWETFIDPSQLELAIMNLVINSRDALPNGGVISIALANRRHEGSADLDGGEFVVLTVSDSGSGIPADVLPRVLEPFFTTKEAGRGTGLGLSMAYGFARQSGGALRIRSQVDVGTDVELWIPRAQIEPLPVDVPMHTPDVSYRTVTSRSAHVLLVDDSQTLRDLTAMQLEEAGFTISSASSGVEAISIIGQDPGRFDVLLTDYAMPVMSGLELVAAARQHRPEFPAVIVTGYAEVEAMKSRPDNVTVVPKPFTAAALIEALHSSLQARA
jgi:signal transduction histidine kinase